MDAVCGNMPFCVCWLVSNSKANIHKKNRRNQNAMFFPMQAYSEQLQFYKTFKVQRPVYAIF